MRNFRNSAAVVAKTLWFWIIIILCLLFITIDNVKADQTFIANNGKSYNWYRTGGKFVIVNNNKPTKVISFEKKTISITGQNCYTNTVQTPTCTPNTDLIDELQKMLEWFRYQCIGDEVKSDIINKISKINQNWIISSNDTECDEISNSKTVEIQTISDIIYIKGKTKYINTFRIADTWAL